jgi:SAM-dependent methyltransferase
MTTATNEHIVNPTAPTLCKICGEVTQDRGLVHGSYSCRDYRLCGCPACGYAFVCDPWLDYAAVYDEAYYDGRGADPLVDYMYELENPERTIRRYEWRGIARTVGEMVGPLAVKRWLDYGCGNGGLVRYLRDEEGVSAVGFEQGAIVARAQAAGIPIIDASALATQTGTYDVVTAIEVLEHTADPLEELRRMRNLLRPGGLLFVTTGNARPYADALQKWKYVTPEIHISFFEPRTLERALALAGFRAEHRPRSPGFDEVLTFKVLKNLRVRRRSPLADRVPTQLVGAVADRITHLSDHPVGWAI